MLETPRVGLHNCLRHGLHNSEAYTQAVMEGRPIPMQEFVADLRFRHQAVWRAIEGHDPRGQPSKLTAYQAWFASPFVLVCFSFC